MNLETSLDAAEPELLALLRGEDATEFSLSIECRSGRWAVRCVTPGTEQSAIVSECQIWQLVTLIRSSGSNWPNLG